MTFSFCNHIDIISIDTLQYVPRFAQRLTVDQGYAADRGDHATSGALSTCKLNGQSVQGYDVNSLFGSVRLAKIARFLVRTKKIFSKQEIF